MPLIAGDMIDQARDLHPAYDDRAHPNKVCLRFLSRWQRQLYAEALTRYPDLDGTEVTVNLPLADFAAGYPLTLPLAIEDGHVQLGSVQRPFTLIPWASRFDPQPLYSGYVKGLTLFLCGREADWNGISEIVLRVTPIPATIVDLDDELILPETAENAVVTALGEFMARRRVRSTAGDLPDPQAAERDAKEARALWLENLWNLSSANVTRIREVM